MPSARWALPPQLRSLGWKIHSRWRSSSEAQPTVNKAAAASPSTESISRFMSAAESAPGLKFSRLPAAQEQPVQLAQGELAPGRPAVVALVGALGLLHLPQQGVHF